MLRLALLRPSIRLHLSAPFRLLTILLSIALGTLLCTVILLVNTAAVQSLEHSVNDLAGETDLSVLSAGGESFTEGTFDRVLRIPGVSAAVPLIQNKAFLLKKDGGQTALTLLGIDLLNDSSVRNKENKDRRFVSDPLDFMARPDSIALTHVLADQTHLKLHDVVSVATAIGIKSFTIRALIDDAGAGKAFGGRVAVMDIEASRVAFGKSGKLDQINLKVEDRGQLKETAARVQSELGSVYSVEPPSNQLQSLRDLIAPIQIVMGFLGLAAFLMAYVLILNTARISISERRREIGILRAIGFERSQIISLLMSEYAILGAVGSGAGSLLAWFGTKQTAKLVQQVLLTQTQVSVDLSEALFNPQIPILVGLFGLVISLLAVFHPLWTASRISPSEAILLQRAEDSAPTLAALRRRSALLILGFVFLLPLIIPLPEKLLVFSLAPILGAILIAPAMASWTLTHSKRIILSIPWPLVTLAWSYVADQRVRVEKTVRGLVVGLLLIFTIVAIQNGFIKSLSAMFLNTSRPDFYVSSNGDFTSPLTLQPIDEKLQVEISKMKGVAGVYGQRIVTTRYEKHEVKLNALDEVPATYFEILDRPAEDAIKEAYHSSEPTIMVTDGFKSLYGKANGDFISLNILDSSIRFKIVGVIRDFSTAGGRIYISRDQYKKYWQDPLVTGVAVVLEKGASVESVKTEIDAKFGQSYGLLYTVDRSIKGDVEAILKKTFLSFYLIEIIFVSVALLGFVSLFSLEIQKRSQEIATLRVVGLSKGELSIFLLTEAALLGFSSSVVTVILAVPISWALITKALPRLLGWVIDFQFDWSACFYVAGIGVVGSLLSSMYAVLWARHLDVSKEIQYE